MEQGNWDSLQNTLTYQEFGLIRHNCGRRVGSWDDVDESIELSSALVKKLPVLHTDKEPMDNLPPEFSNSIFIAILNGDQFLVNTEGYNYCRYIARLVEVNTEFVAVVTTVDPTLDGCVEIARDSFTHKINAKVWVREEAKKINGFGTVYAPDGESLYEVDFTR